MEEPGKPAEDPPAAAPEAAATEPAPPAAAVAAPPAPESEELPAELLELWVVFDRQGSGTLSKSDVLQLLRLGNRYTEAELLELTRPLPELVTKAHLAQLHCRLPKADHEKQRQELAEALEFLSGYSGSLKLSHLSELLATLGEDIPNDEIQQALGEFSHASDAVQVTTLLDYLCRPLESPLPKIRALQQQLEAARKQS